MTKIENDNISKLLKYKMLNMTYSLDYRDASIILLYLIIPGIDFPTFILKDFLEIDKKSSYLK